MAKEQKQYDKQFKIDTVEYFLSQDKSAQNASNSMYLKSKKYLDIDEKYARAYF